MASLKKIRNKIFRNIHKGNKYHCIYCQQTANRFLSAGSHSPRVQKLDAIGIARRKNAVCPFCGSSDRSRLLRLYLTQQLPQREPTNRLLHIAPDDNLARWISIQPYIDFTCGSLYPEDFSEFNAVALDVAKIKFPDNYFDIILCNHVLQQVPDHLTAMQEISRILKPGGWGIIQVPIANKLDTTDEDLSIKDPHEKRERFGSTLHCRIYGRDYSQILQKNGNWKVEEIKLENFLSQKEIIKHALIQNETLYRVNAM
jgi:SAM-dependent methyltransferase